MDLTAEEDTRYGNGSGPTTWADVEPALRDAELYWLATVRPDGSPHVTPLIGLWTGNAMVFCTGAEERKARNLEGNRHCSMTTGANALNQGLDLVVEGDAVRVTDNARLEALAEAYASKYGEGWRFQVVDGAFVGPENNAALVFEIAPVRIFAFGKGEFSQTKFIPTSTTG